jgi:hypothetical protein
MSRAERRAFARALGACACAARVALAGVSGAALAAEEPVYRYAAPIEVQQRGPFVQLPLPPGVYARSERSRLQDVRVVDARGERVPFALLAARASESQTRERLHQASAYALPPRPRDGAPWASPVELTFEGDRISVRRAPGAASAPSASHGVRPPGWLFDLGTRKATEDRPRRLRLEWSGPAEFTAAYTLETSDDLREWRAAGSGHVMALASTGGPLTQPDVALPDAVGRFVRLVWSDAASAPQVTGAKAVAEQRNSIRHDPPTTLELAPVQPALPKGAASEETRRALHFDLGGVLPVIEIALHLPAGTWVAPASVQGRATLDASWRELARTVFYRLERSGEVATSPPVGIDSSVRHLRVVSDERAARLDPAHTRLVVQAQLASLVLASQGEPPYTLLVGSAKAPGSALPIETLVPSLEDERLRFGRASLGEWRENEAAARQAESARRMARLRPWLLWAVLVAGVAGLGWMVWRLARGASRT